MICEDCIHNGVCGLKHEMEVFDKSVSDVVRSGHFKSFDAQVQCNYFRYGDYISQLDEAISVRDDA